MPDPTRAGRVADYLLLAVAYNNIDYIKRVAAIQPGAIRERFLIRDCHEIVTKGYKSNDERDAMVTNTPLDMIICMARVKAIKAFVDNINERQRDDLLKEIIGTLSMSNVAEGRPCVVAMKHGIAGYMYSKIADKATSHGFYTSGLPQFGLFNPNGDWPRDVDGVLKWLCGESELGWFFLDGLTSLYGTCPQAAWTAEHDRPSEDII